MGCNSLAGSNPVRSAKYVVCPGVRKLFRKQLGVKSLAGSSPVRDAKTGTYGGSSSRPGFNSKTLLSVTIEAIGPRHRST